MLVRGWLREGKVQGWTDALKCMKASFWGTFGTNGNLKLFACLIKNTYHEKSARVTHDINFHAAINISQWVTAGLKRSKGGSLPVLVRERQREGKIEGWTDALKCK